MTIQDIAQKLVADKKGLLAADERNSSMEKRFAFYHIENNEENRRVYRELLFSTSGIEQYVSGVIMYDETIRQRADDGHTFVTMLEQKGIIPGIKVDEGTVPFDDNGEVITQGLDGLGDRLQEYKNMGAQFTKWRAVIRIGNGLPTEENIIKNAELLAQYAKMVQDVAMVPIVEPEVLMEGDHDIDRCFDVSKKVLTIVFEQLKKYNVALDGILLKPNMVMPGIDGPHDASAQDIAEKTVTCFKDVVPATVPGIVFLSGGQSEDDAAEHLAYMENMYQDLPWELTFSFGRALQNSALQVWNGSSENVAYAQEVFLSRLEAIHVSARGNIAL